MEKIAKEILEGKRGAVTRFYREYAPGLKRYLAVKLPSEVEAEEILQDVFLSALDSLPLYRGESNLKTWLLSIARHEVADFYRKRYVRQAIEKTAPIFEGMMADLQDPEFEIRKHKIRKRFMKAYKSLSDQHRDVLSYRFELGMSVKEIASRMEKKLKATESLLFRARQAFVVAYEATQ